MTDILDLRILLRTIIFSCTITKSNKRIIQIIDRVGNNNRKKDKTYSKNAGIFLKKLFVVIEKAINYCFNLERPQMKPEPYEI